jgi:hypothetical protein
VRGRKYITGDSGYQGPEEIFEPYLEALRELRRIMSGSTSMPSEFIRMHITLKTKLWWEDANALKEEEQEEEEHTDG